MIYLDLKRVAGNSLPCFPSPTGRQVEAERAYSNCAEERPEPAGIRKGVDRLSDDPALAAGFGCICRKGLVCSEMAVAFDQ